MNSPRAFRTTELAKELARNGHHVTVLTPFAPEHPSFAQQYSLEIKNLGIPTWNEVKLEGRGIELMIRRAVRRLSKWFMEYPDLELTFKVAKALRKERGYDALISIAVPFTIHWGVALNWKKNNKSQNPAKIWIADCGDPYMGAENDSFTPPFYFGWVEKWFMRKVDYVSVPVESAIPAYYHEFHNKIRVIPQGFNFEEVPDCNHKVNAQKPVKFAYAGGLIPGKREPKAFFNYLLSIDKNFEFNIYTGQADLVKPFSDQSEGRIRICDRLPRQELLEKLCFCDFLVNFENAGQKQMPSKLIDYALLKKPILSISTIAFDPKPVEEFLQRNYRNAYRVKNLEKYNIENVAQQFVALCE